MKHRQPLRGVVADLLANAVEQLDGFRASGQDGERVVETAEVEFRDDRVVALLDQEAPAFGSELLLDQPEFRVGQMEAIDIVRARSPRVRQEDLGRALLDDGVGDRRGQRIARRLRAEHHDTVLLADGFQLVVGEIAKRFVAKRLPELVSVGDQAPALDQALHALEQVHHQRCAYGGVVQQVGHVKTNEPGVEADGVVIAIEDPAEWSSPAPSLEPSTNALAILLAEKSPQRPERAFGLPQLTKGSQPGIDALLLDHGQRAVVRRDEFPDQFAQEGKICWRQLQRLERSAAGRGAVVERQIGAAGGADENLGATVLVEENVGRAEPLGLRQQEVLHDGFAGP